MSPLSLPPNKVEPYEKLPPETPDVAQRARVVRACVRCRKQKLKCDAVRPCTLCCRSGFTCEAREDNGPAKTRRTANKRAKREVTLPVSVSPDHKKKQLSLTHNPARTSPQFPPSQSPVEPFRSPGTAHPPHGSLRERQRFGANSSAVGFAARIFGVSAGSHSGDISSIPGHIGRDKMRDAGTPWSLATMPCPPLPLLEALVDVYFDRMHWFTLIFHEPTFRRAAQNVLSRTSWYRSELGHVLACLMVSAIGLKSVARDATWAGHEMLREASLDPTTLIEALIKEIRCHLLDLLDDCSIETVQICSLLGTYYIFHASPTLAWSILGMSVRTAYALTLHCDGDDDNTTGKEYDPVIAQVRRRNWNHILVADTFAAMIYGRPVSLDAAFSYVQPLDPMDDLSFGPKLAQHPLFAPNSPRSMSSLPISNQTFHMLKYYLYDIVREALNRFRLLRLQSPITPEELVSLVQAVQHVRSLLHAWRADLPAVFNTNPAAQEATLAEINSIPDLSPMEELSRRQLCRQINALNVTYNSAVIFIHRPILEYRLTTNSHHALPSETLQVVSESLHLSVNAALDMSRVPVSRLENQFAMSFVLMNFFTAGVILCIPPTTWPLSSIAHEAKAGTLRIIRASRAMKHLTPIASHTEQLLTGLLKRSLQQEVDNGLHPDLSLRNDSNRNYPNAAPADQVTGIPQEAHFPSQEDGEIQNSGTNQVAVGEPRYSQTDRQTPSSTEQVRVLNPSSFTSEQTWDMEAANTVPPMNAIYDENGNIVASNVDPRRGVMDYHYGEQRQQVDSQLDEVFGIFGQMLFNLVPNDPYSAWNWGNGGF